MFLTVIFTYLLFYRYDYYFYQHILQDCFHFLDYQIYIYTILHWNIFSSNAKYNSLLHTWSLGVEEQFYLFFPFIVYYFIYYRKNNKQYKYSISLLFVISLVYFLHLFESNFDGAYYLTHARIWQILLGVLIFTFQRQSSLSLKFDKNIIILFLIILFTIFGSNFSVNPHIFISILTGILIIKSVNNNYSDIVLTSKLFTNIGVISYTLYLWHLPFFTLKYWNNTLLPNIETEILLVLLFSIGTLYFWIYQLELKELLKDLKIYIASFLLLLLQQ